ncbi:YkoF family thiamine/hydroxymethylpyrimidine-binding protein [Priestia endophytica]|jgi:energy-coupling factor transport system substrate-specific component|uniref:YkoF family thiamine/hydroxymethylpyrimidine-binding protein n=1 Tax=Priestia endophytica TaxID=135735 RepID=UPI000F522994|nr:YkoF family thiamine/hydroxymethylpyrimidine-binding protein [Priestia endophytica]RPK12607.1 hypothetical protein FH5_02813 [Priestia endophytica]
MNEQLCGTSRIYGCRFSLYPMCDNFIEVIKTALREVDTSKVWIKTDNVSTCVRGRNEHVFDVVKAIYLHAAKTGVHVVLNGSFSVGCPGDSEGDVYLSEDDVLLNEEKSKDISIETAMQFALYPMGVPHYMDVIMDGVKTAKDQGVFVAGVHYATHLDGDAHTIFQTIKDAFLSAQKEASHVVMTVNLSANSPSTKRKPGDGK